VVNSALGAGRPRARRRLRLLAAVPVVAAAVALTACGSSDSKDDSTSASTGASTATTQAAPSSFPQLKIPQGENSAAGLGKKTIGVVVITQASEVFPQQQKAMQAAFDQLGWTMKLSDIAGDISKVPAAVDNLLQSGVDAVILQSVEPGFVGKQVAAHAKAKGVPIVGVDTGVPVAASEGILTAAIETPFEAPGKAEGEQMVQEFGDGAKVALIIDQLAATGRAGQKGLEAGAAGQLDFVAKHQLDYAKLVPDVTSTTQQWLVQHPDLKAIWCPYDGACVGAGQAVQSAGKDVAIFSMNGTPTAFDLIRQGVNYTTWAAPFDYINWLATDVLVSVLAKHDFQATTNTPVFKIDKSNVPKSGELSGTEMYGDFRRGFEQRWGVGQ
jgi:ribose transport system substrate-binding protein